MTHLPPIPAGAVDLAAHQAARRADQAAQEAAERGPRALSYARKAGVHLWALTLLHEAPEALLAALDAHTTVDLPTTIDTLLAAPQVRCMICGAAYHRRLVHRRCTRGIR